VFRVKLDDDLARPKSKQELNRAETALAARSAYNVSAWPYFFGILAAVFSVAFAIYAIGRAGTARQRHPTPAAVTSAPPNEPLLWIDP
jgi:hypothetical protein